MRFYHPEPTARRKAGFINIEMLVLSGFLIVLASAIVGTGIHFGSHALLVTGIVVGSLGLIFHSVWTVQLFRYLRKRKRKPELDKKRC
jgi:hypothetical protein